MPSYADYAALAILTVALSMLGIFRNNIFSDDIVNNSAYQKHPNGAR
jgi:hypothetical protein